MKRNRMDSRIDQCFIGVGVFFFRLFLFLFLSLRPIRTIDKNHDDTLPLKKFSSHRERLRILIFTLQMYDDSHYFSIILSSVKK